MVFNNDMSNCKKILIFLLSIALIYLCACSNSQLSQVGSSSQADTSATESSTVRVMFREGLTLVEIGKLLEENKVCKAAEFIAATQDINYFKESFDFLSGIEKGDSAFLLEGFIFPDTYDFFIGENPNSVVKRFLNNFNSKLSDEMKEQIQNSNLNIKEIVTLASIIQSECGFENEMSKVSSVFVNRLNSPDFPKLQSDVTSNYVKNFLTDSNYLTDTGVDWNEKYNTYICSGLPAGAVCCPGLAAIKAALNPAETDYYFFVTDSDMNYYYAHTYEEHVENCALCGIYF